MHTISPCLVPQVCSVTCCGIINFEQHCTSKKHLRRAAAVAHATVSSSSLFLPGADATPTASQSSDAANGTTYVGVKAQCRTYCKQVATSSQAVRPPVYYWLTIGSLLAHYWLTMSFNKVMSHKQPGSALPLLACTLLCLITTA